MKNRQKDLIELAAEKNGLKVKISDENYEDWRRAKKLLPNETKEELEDRLSAQLNQDVRDEIKKKYGTTT